MATLRATAAGIRKPTKASGWAGEKQVAWGYYDHSVSPAAADTVIFCKLPKGAIIVGGCLKGDKLDSTGSGSALASINIGLDAAVVTPDGTTVTSASTSNALLTAHSLGPDAAAVVGYKPQADIRNVPFASLLCTHGPLKTTVEPTHVYVTWTASSLAFTTGTMIVEVEYYMDQHN